MYNEEYKIKNKKYDKIQEYINRYEYEKALDLLTDFMTDYPDDDFGKFDYGRCLIRINKIDEGIEILEQLRKKNPKKLAYRISAVLIDIYVKTKDKEKIDKILYSASKTFEKNDFKFLKISYYQAVGLIEHAEKLLDEIKPRDDKERAEVLITRYLTANNDYFRTNKKEVESNLKKYIKKKYITKGAARKIYLKLYISCSNYEEAYNYIGTSEENGPESLLLSYTICKKLNKQYEAKKYLDMINKISESRNINELSLLKAQILFINNKKDEAFEICKKLGKNDLDAALELCIYSVNLGRTLEIIDIIKETINSNSIDNRKTIIIIERLTEILIYNERYQEAYELFQKYSIYMKEDLKEEMYAFLVKKLNLDIEVKSKRYIINQIINYNYNQAVEHIAKHKYENKNKIVHTVFNDEISIEELIKMIKPHLISENLYDVGVINRYEIDCTNIDLNEERIVVGTLSETGDIVFCYPYKQNEEELDKIVENEDKVVRKTGLQRFNERYKNYLKNK